MQVDLKASAAHYWITAIWCAFGVSIFGAVAVISCWIRKCRQKLIRNYGYSGRIYFYGG